MAQNKAHSNFSDYCYRKYIAVLQHVDMEDFESFNGSTFKKCLEKYQKIIYVSNALSLTQKHV